MRKLLRPATILPIVGIVGLMAATPLLTRGETQSSPGMVATPVSVQASITGFDGSRGPQAGAAARTLELAKDVLGDRLDRAFDAAMNEDAAPTPRFADFDPRRLPVRPAAAERRAGVEHYAVLPGDASAVSVASLDERFAPARLPESADAATAATIALALAAREEEALISETGEEDMASLETVMPDRIAVPIPRPKHVARAKQEAHTVLAYANPDAETEEESSDGIFGRLFGKRTDGLLPERGSKVAVYDIGAAVVYMPNGEKLEAHSGLAHMKDNPRYADQKNKGPTPPNLYNLRMREARFHGVEAIRLLPADGKKKYNRDGLLAHTYMYVAGGGKDRSQSNGCVVFKDYDRFLQAFKRGEVKHMIVVGHLKEVPTYMAAL